MLKKHKQFIVYLIPTVLFLFFIQFFYIKFSNDQIKGEELAEAIRSVFFWAHGETFWGCTNIGYYSILLFIYKVFGFTIFTAKYFKLFLYLFSLVFLAIFFYKRIGVLNSVLLLLIIGTSPTLLYFNTLLTPYGIDFLFYPICIFMLYLVRTKAIIVSLFVSFMLWFLIMLACLSYPVFLFYVPLFIFSYLWIFFRDKETEVFKRKGLVLLTSLAGFILPLVVFLLYSNDPSKILFDPLFGQGLFRGGSALSFSLATILGNIKVLYSDLFDIGKGYYFETQLSEFIYLKYFFVLINIFFVYLGVLNQKSRKITIAVYVTLLTGLLLTCMTVGFPGIRKATFSISLFYTLLFISMSSTYYKKIKFRKLNITLLMIFSFILLIHHFMLVYYNLSKNRPDFIDSSANVTVVVASGVIDPYTNKTWFNVVSDDPQRSLEYWIAQIDKGDVLYMESVCGYSEIYPAVAGYYLWNRGLVKKIAVRDLYDESNSEVDLSFDSWLNQYISPLDSLCGT